MRTFLGGLGLAAAILGTAKADVIYVSFPDQPERSGELRTFFRGPVEYINASELASLLATGSYTNHDVDKQVLRFGDKEMKLTAYSSFIMVEQQAFQIPHPIYHDGTHYYLPARAIFTLLGRTVLEGASYDPARRLFMGPSHPMGYNIFEARTEFKRNGTLVRLRTTQTFDPRNLVRYITDGGWLVVQVPEGKVDSVSFARSRLGGLIQSVRSRQLEAAAELRFRLSEKISLPEVYQTPGGGELHIAIRNPDRKKNNRAEEMKERWYLDTIVIDAGHGGKDPGTIGRDGLQEKTVTLDVALRLGQMIKRRTSMNVVYTRDEDVFVPLFQRTKMANEADGKVFVSIHVNGNPSRGAMGFDTWFLAPANTEEAIEVARLENSVIALEESDHQYGDYSDEALILSTMAHSAWNRESEDLAAIIQNQLDQRLDSKNRGVKQAGFVVLIGASMPKVLVEVGFITNRIEEKKLEQNEYRQRIAEGLYDALLLFKEKYESAMGVGS